MPNNKLSVYLTPSITSAILHIGLIGFLVVGFTSSSISINENKTNQKEVVEVIQATTVDTTKVQAEINRILAEEKTQRDAEVAHQRQLQQQADTARKQRANEQKRLAQLQQQAKKAEVDRKAKEQEAREKLANIEKQQIIEAKRVQEAEKRSAALAAQQKIEAERIARLKAEQDALAKQQQAEVEKQRLARARGEVERYSHLIKNAIMNQWIYPPHANESSTVVLEVRLSPTGHVLNIKMITSSGDAILDRSAQTAVYRAEPLPVPSDEHIFSSMKTIKLTMNPKEILTD